MQGKKKRARNLTAAEIKRKLKGPVGAVIRQASELNREAKELNLRIERLKGAAYKVTFRRY
jgi:hypothetical protein